MAQDDDRSPLLRPTRWPAVLGFVLVVAGSVMPWQTMTYPAGPPVVTRGLDGGAMPGLQAILFAAVVLVLVALRSIDESRTRTFQLAPAVFGLATLALCIQFYRDVAPGDWWNPGRPSDVVVEGGMWAVLVGSLLVAIGGIATSIAIVRARPTRDEREDRAPVNRRTLETAAAGVVGIVAGLAVLAWLGGTAMGNSPGMTLVALVCLIGGPAASVAIFDVARRWIRGDVPRSTDGVYRERVGRR